MNVEVALSGSVVSVEALVKFLRRLEKLVPAPVRSPKVITGDDGVIYVKAGFATEDEAWQAGEKMAEISAEIVEDTDILVVLAPLTV
jgi:hypothetical protein